MLEFAYAFLFKSYLFVNLLEELTYPPWVEEIICSEMIDGDFQSM